MNGSWLDHLALVSLGLLVAAIAAIPARRLLRRDPSTCYRLCLALLFGALALLPLQWFVQGVAHDWVAPARAGIVRWLAPAPPRPRSRLIDDGAVLVDGPARSSPVAAPTAPPVAAAPITTPATLLLPPPGAAAPMSSRFADPLVRGGRRIAAACRVAAAQLKGRLGLALWLLGVGFVLGRRLLGAGRTLRLLRSARPVTEPELLAIWRQVAGSSPVAERVRLLSSSEIASPACVGWFRPILLLPGGSQPALRKEVLAWALRHELVHLERGDSRVAALQALVTALLWFHPAAWWLSAEIGRLRELSCDQLVVGGSGRRRSYALALLEYAAARNGTSVATDAGPHSAGVRCALLHWSRSPSQMHRRIEMLTVDSESGSSGRRTLGRLFALCAFVAPALAQVGVAATLLPKDGGSVDVRAAAAPVARPSVSVSAGRGSHAEGSTGSVTVVKPCAVGGDGDGCCAKAGAANASPKPAAHAGGKVAHTRSVELAGLQAQVDDERAAVQKQRARSQARAQALRLKLKAAEAADDEDASAAIESALERCEAECDAADEACEAACAAACEDACEAECEDACEDACEVECEDLADLEDLEELPAMDLAVEPGALGDLGELGYVVEGGDVKVVDLAALQAELPAIQEQVRKAMASADEELAVAVKELRAAQQSLDGDEKQALEKKIRRLIEQKRVQQAQADEAVQQALRAAGAAQGKQLDEAKRELLRARVQAARKTSSEKLAQDQAQRAQDHAQRAQELAQRQQEFALRAEQQARSRQERVENARARTATRRDARTPPPIEPQLPSVDTAPVPPRPPDAPAPQRWAGAGRGRTPFAPAPPEADQRALLEKIAALEAEIAELRAALEASHGGQSPASPPPAQGSQRRPRSLR